MIEVSNLVPFLLFGFIISVCGLFDMPYDKSSMVVCEGDMCLRDNFNSCTPAYGNMANENYNVYFEIRGLKDNGKCEIFVKLEDINMEVVPEEFQSVANLAIGRSMICEAEEYQKEEVLKGNFDKTMLSNCNGVLANALETVAPYLE
jgi:hypothetical protein